MLTTATTTIDRAIMVIGNPRTMVAGKPTTTMIGKNHHRSITEITTIMSMRCEDQNTNTNSTRRRHHLVFLNT